MLKLCLRVRAFFQIGRSGRLRHNQYYSYQFGRYDYYLTTNRLDRTGAKCTAAAKYGDETMTVMTTCSIGAADT